MIVQVKYTNQISSPKGEERECTTTEPKKCARSNQPGTQAKACLLLDQIKREKGVWWMPWQQEAMKDVIPCDKPWGAGNRL